MRGTPDAPRRARVLHILMLIYIWLAVPLARSSQLGQYLTPSRSASSENRIILLDAYVRAAGVMLVAKRSGARSSVSEDEAHKMLRGARDTPTITSGKGHQSSPAAVSRQRRPHGACRTTRAGGVAIRCPQDGLAAEQCSGQQWRAQHRRRRADAVLAAPPHDHAHGLEQDDGPLRRPRRTKCRSAAAHQAGDPERLTGAAIARLPTPAPPRASAPEGTVRTAPR